MKIIDNTQKIIHPEEMKIGAVYKVMIEYMDPKEYIVMKVEHGDCMNNYIPLVDLYNGTYFEVRCDEFGQIKPIDAKLVID